jgi:hypothetical protein
MNEAFFKFKFDFKNSLSLIYSSYLKKKNSTTNKTKLLKNKYIMKTATILKKFKYARDQNLFIFLTLKTILLAI